MSEMSDYRMKVENLTDSVHRGLFALDNSVIVYPQRKVVGRIKLINTCYDTGLELCGELWQELGQLHSQPVSKGKYFDYSYHDLCQTIFGSVVRAVLGCTGHDIDIDLPDGDVFNYLSEEEHSADIRRSITNLFDKDEWIDGFEWLHYATAQEQAKLLAMERDISLVGGNKSRELYHTDISEKPKQYKYGPIEGTQSALGKYLGGKNAKTARQLQHKINTGVVWVLKMHQRRYQAWFYDQKQYAEANGKRLEIEGSKTQPTPKDT